MERLERSSNPDVEALAKHFSTVQPAPSVEPTGNRRIVRLRLFQGLGRAISLLPRCRCYWRSLLRSAFEVLDIPSTNGTTYRTRNEVIIPVIGPRYSSHLTKQAQSHVRATRRCHRFVTPETIVAGFAIFSTTIPLHEYGKQDPIAISMGYEVCRRANASVLCYLLTKDHWRSTTLCSNSGVVLRTFKR